jgi:hypothetical protein
MSEWEEEQGFDEEEEEVCPYVFEFCEDPQTREAGLCTTECNTYLCSVEAEVDGGTSTWKCSVCGCTDTNPCITNLPGAAIETCHWVRKNLCSTCADKQKQEQKQQVQENMDKSIAKHVSFSCSQGNINL